jgi:GNAT superfamily N-acetyltransferase
LRPRWDAVGASGSLIELRRPEVLDAAKHDRSRFDSGAPALDEWLRRFAGQNRRRDTAATWVITDLENKVMAYASIAITGIDRSATPPRVARHAPDPVPAVLIARLAVDRRVGGLGVGTALVAHVLSTAVDLNTKAACRAVVVDALDATARSWWERLGFTPFDPADPDGLDLYLLTADIEATLRSLG